MKQKVGALCLAAALLVLSGCGGSSLSIESRQWNCRQCWTAKPAPWWPAGPPGKKRTRTRLWSLSAASPRGTPRPTGAGENLHRHLPAGRALPKGHGVPSHCGGQRRAGCVFYHGPPHRGAGSHLGALPPGGVHLVLHRRIKKHDKKPRKGLPSWAFFLWDVTRPVSRGSVVDSHLSWPDVAIRLTPPPRDARARCVSLHGVASDRVYRAAQSPARR